LSFKLHVAIHFVCLLRDANAELVEPPSTEVTVQHLTLTINYIPTMAQGASSDTTDMIDFTRSYWRLQILVSDRDQSTR